MRSVKVWSTSSVPPTRRWGLRPPRRPPRWHREGRRRRPPPRARLHHLLAMGSIVLETVVRGSDPCQPFFERPVQRRCVDVDIIAIPTRSHYFHFLRQNHTSTRAIFSFISTYIMGRCRWAGCTNPIRTGCRGLCTGHFEQLNAHAVILQRYIRMFLARKELVRNQAVKDDDKVVGRMG